jgi:lipopolysaccharide biosynthesis glycosyltransferase
MEPVALALASNERYFPGLYCAVASALSCLQLTRKVELKVLDGGISPTSRDTLSRLIDCIGERVRLEFVPIDESVFRGATRGPGESHMTYCRIVLPHLLDVPCLIYLDCDVLVFRDLAQLFDLELSPGKVLAAVPDSETLSLAEDCPTIADAMGLPAEGAYFNCGVMLMNLDALREQHFFERAGEFLNRKSAYRFWDQSAINFLLHGQIHELPEYWNRASWQFDAQQNNDLDCVLHYTTSAPWLGGRRGPAQVLFERFAVDAGLSVDPQIEDFKKRSRRQQFFRNALAPFRALAFPLVSLFYKVAGRKEKCAVYQKSARYWLRYILTAPRRRRLYSKRAGQIQDMKFKLAVSKSAA